MRNLSNLRPSVRGFALILALGAGLAHAAKETRLVGVGLAYASPTRSAFTNPSLFHEGKGTGLEGLWAFDSGTPSMFLSSGFGKIGAGAGWTHGGSSHHVGGGFSAVVGSDLALGLALRSTDFSGASLDLGLTTHLSRFRLTGVVRGLGSGASEVALGLGFQAGELLFAFDVTKGTPWDLGPWVLAANLGFDAGRLSATAGITSRVASGNVSTGAQAGLGFAVTQAVALEAFYHPPLGAAGGSEFVAGARAVF